MRHFREAIVVGVAVPLVAYLVAALVVAWVG
jgi:hypothetical protein